ncbi:MAG: hypothetical protein Q7U72_13100 [Brevundimonas sp.]|uniref:hypothetical protein n=1 Tax=Brevundimonas sp. TaxID=1871086 RepID=UPI002716678C|nr:hypothetical protein [Brevundimonas sp.]MDO9078369.1 hypothetical protein [Brevundimonas sp.]MDP3368774.1 hypothetical protein [Brevundimonas sp.]MDZ4061210.1 hypothetical protein [Brevundimonas sp.]
MLSAQDKALLDELASRLASDLADQSSQLPDMQIRFDLHVALQHTLVTAGIPESRLTKDWSPKDDFNKPGWLLQLYRFQDALHARNPVYRAFGTTPRHAAGSLNLKRLKVESYLFERVKYALARGGAQ